MDRNKFYELLLAEKVHISSIWKQVAKNGKLKGSLM